MPENIQSRFTVLERPTESPGQCLVCGAVDRPVVDFGVDIDWAELGFGRAYLCVTCIKQASSKFPDMEKDLVPAEYAVAELAVFKESLTGALHDVLVHFNPGPLSPSPIITAGVQSEEPEPNDPGIIPDLGTDEPGESGPGLEDDSDDSGEGPVSVPSNSGDGQPKPFSFDL